jgi:hypothetical protein
MYHVFGTPFQFSPFLIMSLFLCNFQSGHDRVQELSQQLALEKNRSETYKRNLELLYEYIEEHNETVSKKIQEIVESVKEMEAKEQENPSPR